MYRQTTKSVTCHAVPNRCLRVITTNNYLEVYEEKEEVRGSRNGETNDGTLERQPLEKKHKSLRSGRNDCFIRLNSAKGVCADRKRNTKPSDQAHAQAHARYSHCLRIALAADAYQFACILPTESHEASL